MSGLPPEKGGQSVKKVYEKPAVGVENFALSQQISACVYLKVGFNSSSCITENRDQSDKLIPGYGHLLGLAKAGYFWDPSGCQILGSFATDNDQICYHTLANLAFTS